jgi:hypothetical protein
MIKKIVIGDEERLTLFGLTLAVKKTRWVRISNIDLAPFFEKQLIERMCE